MKTPSRTLLFMNLILCGTISMGHATDAAGILAKTPLKRGIVCLPEALDGQTALELAKTPGWTVMALVPDTAAREALSAQGMAAGVIGKSFYVDNGSAESIPFADNFVDLIVLNGKTSQSLSPSAMKEILRVLSPIHGKLVLDDKTITKPELAGSDWWTHKRHSPNNNPVSKDTVFQFPPLTQWRAMPMNDSGHGAAVTTQGIKLEIYDWAVAKTGQTGLAGRMLARNVYNGTILWETLAPAILPSAPIIAASDDTFFVASGEKGEVLRFSAVTGEHLPPLAFGDEEHRVKWLALDGDRLYVLLGGVATLKEPFSFYVPPPPGQWEKHELFGNHLIAYNLKENAVVWEHKEPTLIDDTAVAIEQGRLFFYVDEKRLVCLDALTGTELWSNADPEWIGQLNRPPRKPHNVYVANTPNMMVSDGYIALTVAEAKVLHAFSVEDGKRLSTLKSEAIKMMIQDGKIVKGTVPYDPVTGNKLEGELPSPAGVAWCGLMTYAPGTGPLGHSTLGFKSACAQGIWVSGGILTYSPTICNCDVLPGAIGFASGSAVLTQAEQSDDFPLETGPAFGQRLSSADNDLRDWPQYRRDPQRQASSPATLGSVPNTVWTHAPAHPFAFNTAYNQYSLHFDERPTSSVIADGKVYDGASDGVVRALSLADGKVVWRFVTGGAVMNPPAWHGGLLFVPSSDGWLYALFADDGSLAWRRRIAPLERRISVFGKLVSNWPVSAVLADDGTVYACAGMMHHDGAIVMALDAFTGGMRWKHFAPPSREKLQGSHQFPDHPVFGIGGNMAKAGRRLWVNGHGTPPLVLDVKDGTHHRYPTLAKFSTKDGYRGYAEYTIQGKEIMAVPGSGVLIGGGPLWIEQQMREGKYSRTKFQFYKTDANGDWDENAFPIEAIKFARLAPASDAESLMFAGPLPFASKRGSSKNMPDQAGSDSGSSNSKLERNLPQVSLSLHAWKTPAFIGEVNSLQITSKYDEEKMQASPGRIFFKRGTTELFRPLNYQTVAWSNLEMDMNALALTKNAVVVTRATSFRELSSGEMKTNPRGAEILYDGWQLAAYDRGTAKPLWTRDLPCEPLQNGLVIADDGAVVVTLRDGSLLCVKSQ